MVASRTGGIASPAEFLKRGGVDGVSVAVAVGGHLDRRGDGTLVLDDAVLVDVPYRRQGGRPVAELEEPPAPFRVLRKPVHALQLNVAVDELVELVAVVLVDGDVAHRLQLAKITGEDDVEAPVGPEGLVGQEAEVAVHLLELVLGRE